MEIDTDGVREERALVPNAIFACSRGVPHPGRCKEPILFKHLGRLKHRHGAGSDAGEHPNQEHAGGAYYHTMCLREREREERGRQPVMARIERLALALGLDPFNVDTDIEFRRRQWGMALGVDLLTDLPHPSCDPDRWTIQALLDELERRQEPESRHKLRLHSKCSKCSSRQRLPVRASQN